MLVLNQTSHPSSHRPLRKLLFPEVGNWTAGFLEVQHFCALHAFYSLPTEMISLSQIFYSLCCAFANGSLLPRKCILLLFTWVLSRHPLFKGCFLQETFPAFLRNVQLYRPFFVFPWFFGTSASVNFSIILSSLTCFCKLTHSWAITDFCMSYS